MARDPRHNRKRAATEVCIWAKVFNRAQYSQHILVNRTHNGSTAIVRVYCQTTDEGNGSFLDLYILLQN